MSDDDVSKQTYYNETNTDDGIIAIDQPHLCGKLKEPDFAFW